jgi:hypothetical protein
LARVVPVKPTRSVGALEATRRLLEDQEAQLLTTRRKPRGVKQEGRGLDAKRGKQIKYYLKGVSHKIFYFRFFHEFAKFRNIFKWLRVFLALGKTDY